jgi:hypothetical protein
VPKLTVTDLQQMKRDGKKIQAAICYEHQTAQISTIGPASTL